MWTAQDILVPPLRLHVFGGGDARAGGSFRYRLADDLQLRLDPGLAEIPILDLRPVFERPRFLVPGDARNLFDGIVAESEDLPWTVPDVDPARGGDPLETTLRALLRTPWARQARGRLEAMGRRELERIWRRAFRGRPGNIAIAAPVVLSVAAGGLVTIASAHNFELPRLPAIPMGVPGLSLQITYVHRIQDAVRDPLRPREAGVMLRLDLTRLVRELR